MEVGGGRSWNWMMGCKGFRGVFVLFDKLFSSLFLISKLRNTSVGKNKSVIMIDLLLFPLFRLGFMRSHLNVNMHPSSGWF